MALAHRQVRHLLDRGRIVRGVVAGDRLTAAGDGGRVGDAGRGVRRHVHRQRDRRVVSVNGEHIFTGAGQRSQHAVPPVATDRCRRQTGGERVREGDRRIGRAVTAVADHDGVGRPRLALSEVAGVGLSHRHIRHLNHRSGIAGGIVVRDRLATARDSCRVRDARRGRRAHIHRQRNRRVGPILGQDIRAGAGQGSHRAGPARSAHRRRRQTRRQRVRHGDRRIGRSVARVADRQCVGGTRLALPEVTRVALGNDHVSHLDDLGWVGGAVIPRRVVEPAGNSHCVGQDVPGSTHRRIQGHVYRERDGGVRSARIQCIRAGACERSERAAPAGAGHCRRCQPCGQRVGHGYLRALGGARSKVADLNRIGRPRLTLPEAAGVALANGQVWPRPHGQHKRVGLGNGRRVDNGRLRDRYGGGAVLPRCRCERQLVSIAG